MPSSKNHPESPALLSSPFDRLSRRDSVSSQSVASLVDKEQLAQALDKIHTSASQSDVLTTFNDFGAPPTAVPVAEAKGTAGDLVQQGLSGFYSRLKEAVGVGGKAALSDQADNGPDSQAAAPSSGAPNITGPSHSRAKSSVSSLPRGESGAANSAFSSNLSSEMPTTVTSSSGGITSESYSQLPQSSKASSVTTMSTAPPSTKATTSTHALPKLGRAPASAAVDTSNASGAVSMYNEPPRTSGAHHIPNLSGGSNLYDMQGDKPSPGVFANGTATSVAPQGLDGTGAYHGVHLRSPSDAGSMSTSGLAVGIRQLRGDTKMPAVIDRLGVGAAAGLAAADVATAGVATVASASSSAMRSPSFATDTGTTETHSISMSAHDSVYHESFARDEQPERLQSGQMHIPGTTTNEGAPEMVSARLEYMRKQVLSKDFWMADETCKECFRCGDPFSAFRRKHHCRTCGWIFDGKCTSTISGQKFGVPGSLRVCKNCLDIINRRYDSGSEESDDPRLTTLLRSNTVSRPQYSTPRTRAGGGGGDSNGNGVSERASDRTEGADDTRSHTTPMMAIPATRRKGDPSNRNSAILEIDAPQLSRPGSSRSLKSLASVRPTSSAGHMRHHSKPNFHWTHKTSTAAEDRVPFRKDVADEMGRRSRLPAFHDDNIIDPELAPYMSDESSGDEQMSIFATMAGSDLAMASSLDPDKASFGPFLSTSRKHRARGEKSISGLSFTNRGQDKEDGLLSMTSAASHSRVPGRLRNMSTASIGPGNQHHLRSPRTKASAFKGPSISSEALGLFDASGGLEGVPPSRGGAVANARVEKTQLSAPSLRHIKRLFRQQLEDAKIPNPAAWEKTLILLLRRCAEDVDPNTREGDRMDIRHYVKLKKIPGGKPSDSSYVSGVIFTKNLALKSMPRRIAHPRILIVSFPIEYQRQQQHQFMSLEPVMSQEKEFLKMVVARIRSHQPEVVLAERNVAGLALQSLAEAGIAVAYNVKASVIGAVSRCVGTPVISSMDMLSLPITIGRCAEFEVKTFVNNDIPGRKKTYIFLSGCEKFLGCTIALRGTSTQLLARMKQITEFMVYVVYSLKLESCLLNDASVQMPPLESDAAKAALKAANSSQPSATTTTSISQQSASSTVVSAENGTDHKPADGDSADSPPTSQLTDAGGQTSQAAAASTTAAEEGPTPAADTPNSAPESHQPLVSLQDDAAQALQLRHAPEDVPAPTFYSDMVEKYKTKILSASPFVRFTQPYLLVRAREQEARLLYLKKLRDQTSIEEGERDSSGAPTPAAQQQFQLINPEMVHEIGPKAPRQVLEVLHAVHDAEYDKALHSYQTMTRQWENYIQGNLDLFDPYSHQNIVVLYSLTCTETKIPCLEPGLIGIAYYNELPDPAGPMDADCTLGQYVQDLIDGADEVCHANGCDRHMWQHHRTYVHGEARVTFFVEPEAKLPSAPEPAPKEESGGQLLGDGGDDETVYMWSYCKLCKRDLTVRRLSASAWKYSFGKYLELLFWSRGLRLQSATGCVHDYQKDHIRYFYYRGASVRVHYDPIDLLELVVPRARITWKVDHDLKLKNDIFARTQERWVRFITSVKARIKSIRIDSVLPDKEKDCRAEVERLAKKASEEHVLVLRGLERAYMQSKHYEIIPLNATVRTMAEKIAEWDAAFAKFEADYLSDKDVRQLTVIQLRKMFTDNDSKESLQTATTTPSSGPPTANTSFTDGDKSSPPTSQLPADSPTAAEGQSSQPGDEQPQPTDDAATAAMPIPGEQLLQPEAAPSEQVASLDLATSVSPSSPETLPVKEQPASPTASSPEPLPHPSMLPVSVGPSSLSKAGRAGPVPIVTQQSLTEKVEQLRRQFQAQSAEINEAAQTLAQGGEPTSPQQPHQQQSVTKAGSSHRPIPDAQRGQFRKAGPLVSPPMVRALSQPAGAGARTLKKDPSKAFEKAVIVAEAGGSGSVTDTAKGTSVAVDHPAMVEKKFSDRIGLSVLKGHRKTGQSSIPRFVHKKKVTSLTQHFERLSREFEKERNRERRQQAARMPHHPRAYFPKSSARATVEVYDSVDQAFQEPGPTDDEHVFMAAGGQRRGGAAVDASQAAGPCVANKAITGDAQAAFGQGEGQDSGILPIAPLSSTAGTADITTATTTDPSQEEASPTTIDDPPSQPAADADDLDHKDKSAAGSDDEEGGIDADQSLEDILPDVETIATHLEPSGTVPTELQQDKKSNLMKMLSNFWAERSPSGWPQLEYPLRPTDHIFIDSDVIVREDEPSSLIAFALSSEDYIAKLEDILRDGRRAARKSRRRAGRGRHGDPGSVKAEGQADGEGEDGDGEESLGGDDADDESVGDEDDDKEDAEEADAEGERDERGERGDGGDDGGDDTDDENDGEREEPVAEQTDGQDGETGAVLRDPSLGSSDDANEKRVPPPTSPLPPLPHEPSITLDEEELERSLLRPMGTHLKYQFTEGSARMMCKIFYAEQFDALRRKCGVADRIIESLSRCLKWDSKGGKTKSVFLKTLDDRLVMKSLSPVETAAFLRFAPSYFRIMAEALFHDLPSVIAKMLGFFQVIVKNAATGTEIKLDLLIMENLFYDRQETRKFDLKGSMRNRKIQSTGEQNEVLLDENMVEYIYESPLFAREHAKKLLWASVWNDTLFLARQNVMDYSLMVAVDESRKELVVGIIDCIRTYTWDKKLESWIKDRGFAGGGRNRPTVTSPKEYKSRFREAMDRYILQAPNCWHLFGSSMGYNAALAQRARFDDE